MVSLFLRSSLTNIWTNWPIFMKYGINIRPQDKKNQYLRFLVATLNLLLFGLIRMTKEPLQLGMWILAHRSIIKILNTENYV
jgi:hypothetical protein